MLELKAERLDYGHYKGKIFLTIKIQGSYGEWAYGEYIDNLNEISEHIPKALNMASDRDNEAWNSIQSANCNAVRQHACW